MCIRDRAKKEKKVWKYYTELIMFEFAPEELNTPAEERVAFDISFTEKRAYSTKPSSVCNTTRFYFNRNATVREIMTRLYQHLRFIFEDTSTSSSSSSTHSSKPNDPESFYTVKTDQVSVLLHPSRDELKFDSEMDVPALLERVYGTTNPTEPREPEIEDRWGTKSIPPITTPVAERAYIKLEVYFKDVPYAINVRKLHVPYEYVPLHQSSIERINSQAMEAEESANVYDCLRLFEEREQLEEDNMWYCSSCKEHKRAFKKMDLYKVPKILLIHLKRFKGSGLDFSGKSKIFDKIGYPVQGLDLTEHVLNPDLPGDHQGNLNASTASTSSTVMEEEKSNNMNGIQGNADGSANASEKKKVLYDLYGVILHSGNMGFGHYIAYAYNQETGGWYCFNDSDVSPIDPTRLVSENAYCLLYRRRDQSKRAEWVVFIIYILNRAPGNLLREGVYFLNSCELAVCDFFVHVSSYTQSFTHCLREHTLF
eukprot:TRINITY_DN9509_c0_g1_i1.p1 TRINITY_DN9509_c0_g1~~TRINITY_DN9509_c0_g1_i1.p1  ORF type:complete len:502 (-),score=105.55 TRINITY_DN9509_c0_g1_i1:118-1563(-)